MNNSSGYNVLWVLIAAVLLVSSIQLMKKDAELQNDKADNKQKHNETVVSPEQAGTGNTISSDDGIFKVTLPQGFAGATSNNMQYDSEVGKVETTQFSSQNGSSICLVNISKYPEEAFKNNSPKQLLDYSNSSLVSNMGGRITDKRDFYMSGCQARTTYFEVLDDGTMAYSRIDIVLSDPFFYQVLYVTDKKPELQSQDILAYLNSITINK